MSPAKPAPSAIRIVPLTAALWQAGGRDVFQAGIATGHSTLTKTAPDWADFAADKPPEHRWAAVDGDGTCRGWACVSPAFNRCVYSGVVEDSVYVDPALAGRGVGESLLHALVASTEGAGIWTIEALIFPENEVSIRLHRRVGFRDVGIRERMGFMTHGPAAGQWRDVLLLERRSHTVGT
ncbi:MAG: N-acetyltransferase [Austwickia sp.]|jgi:L-amino acid N-acyltransferase YncA|nr:MAG: N-acetyltransferase [Austwickia sp.]